jgi:hypothetical protein
MFEKNNDRTESLMLVASQRFTVVAPPWITVLVMFFDAQAVHFTQTSKYVVPISYEEAMSRPDANEWRGDFDKEMNGLKKRNVF